LTTINRTNNDIAIVGRPRSRAATAVEDRLHLGDLLPLLIGERALRELVRAHQHGLDDEHGVVALALRSRFPIALIE
jgi:hypothetical protein